MLTGASVRPGMTWMTTRRLRAQGIALAICLWGVYAWVLWTPNLRGRNGLIKGTDFLHFYTLGSLALQHRGAELYSMQAQSEVLGQRVPPAAGTLYLPLYGPQVSLLFAPLAKLTYWQALAAWWILTVTLYGICCYAVWRDCANLHAHRLEVFILAVAYPAFFHLIAWGQTSALALVCFTAAYLMLQREQLFVAGLALGCLAFKPQLALAVAFVFILARGWKIIVGGTIAATVQLGAGWIYYGTGVMRDYVTHTLSVSRVLTLLEPRLYQTHSLRTFWQMLIPQPALAFWFYVGSAVATLIIAFMCWRSPLPLALRYSALLLATALVSPHLTVYDLVILAPALLLSSDWVVANPESSGWRVPLLLYLVYILPLIGPASRWTHLQLSVVAMAALLWGLWQLGSSEHPSGADHEVPLPPDFLGER